MIKFNITKVLIKREFILALILSVLVTSTSYIVGSLERYHQEQLITLKILDYAKIVTNLHAHLAKTPGVDPSSIVIDGVMIAFKRACHKGFSWIRLDVRIRGSPLTGGRMGQARHGKQGGGGSFANTRAPCWQT